ncbi:MAG TPA: exopolyphosphatase [Burkholderiales bacterium]|nr:exopolyphosphatase [Burkholderiales bacterium]
MAGDRGALPSLSTLAAVDLGSNSFRLQVARVVDHQIYPLDALREPVRLAAGLTADKRLDEASQRRALQALQRFGERLRGLPPEAVRAVGTNALRVAKNAREFLVRAEAALGFPIEVVAGREEARLIYLGVAHSLPVTGDRRLVIDIGGGSTEFIIGAGYRPQKLESLYMGCVSYSLRYFPGGKLTKSAFKQAETAARLELQTIRQSFSSRHWKEAVGSSGTARALGDILAASGWCDDGISSVGLDRLRSAMLKAADLEKLSLPGLRPDRIPVLPGGFAIMAAAFDELDIQSMMLATGAMRQGVLYDMLGRFHHQDMRDSTVAQFMKRYHVDLKQARRVEDLALALLRQFSGDWHADPDYPLHLLSWAARLHEIGLSVAHSGYHKHSAYIIANADMPGFSKMDQAHLALLVLAHRGTMEKMKGQISNSLDLAMVMALRLAVLFHRSHAELRVPPFEAHCEDSRFYLSLDPQWVGRNPLTAAALKEEVREWKKVGVSLEIGALSDTDSETELSIVS